jgi:hypothetical protein
MPSPFANACAKRDLKSEISNGECKGANASTFTRLRGTQKSGHASARPLFYSVDHYGLLVPELELFVLLELVPLEVPEDVPLCAPEGSEMAPL